MPDRCISCHAGTPTYCAACVTEFAKSNVDHALAREARRADAVEADRAPGDLLTPEGFQRRLLTDATFRYAFEQGRSFGDAVEGDRPRLIECCSRGPLTEVCRTCVNAPIVRFADAGGGVEGDRPCLDIPFRRDEPDREMVRELDVEPSREDRRTRLARHVERASAQVRSHPAYRPELDNPSLVPALEAEVDRLEARVVELKEALRDIAPLLLKAGFILPQHAIERDRLIEKHDAVLSAVLAAAGEGDGPRCETSAHDAIVEAYRQSGSRLPEPEVNEQIYRRASAILMWFDEHMPWNTRNPEDYDLISYCVLTYATLLSGGDQDAWNVLEGILEVERAQHIKRHTRIG